MVVTVSHKGAVAASRAVKSTNKQKHEVDIFLELGAWCNSKTPVMSFKSVEAFEKFDKTFLQFASVSENW